MDENAFYCLYGITRRAFADEKCDAAQTAPLTLAYIGDTIYDLYVRSHLISSTQYTVANLHSKATKLVCASAQAKSYQKIEPLLSDEEKDIFRRGRNTHSSVPKSSNPSDYRTATGLEALLGYLYLTEQDDRLNELMSIIIHD